MDFDSFILRLKHRLTMPLPGQAAHFKMAPPGRLNNQQNFELNKKSPRKSAVLICLYPSNNGVSVVLMLRPNEMGFHSNQVSFPGGSYDESDGSLETTALREAHEELGIKASALEIITALTPLYIPVSNFWVQPFLSYSNHKLTFSGNHEVQAVIESNISFLFDQKSKGSQAFTSGNNSIINAPYYRIRNHLIWGATAMILSELEEILRSTHIPLNK